VIEVVYRTMLSQDLVKHHYMKTYVRMYVWRHSAVGGGEWSPSYFAALPPNEVIRISHWTRHSLNLQRLFTHFGQEQSLYFCKQLDPYRSYVKTLGYSLYRVIYSCFYIYEPTLAVRAMIHRLQRPVKTIMPQC